MKRPNKLDYFIYAIWRWWWLNRAKGKGDGVTTQS